MAGLYVGHEIVAKTLKALSVEYVFTLPGSYVLGILDSISKERIKLVTASSEQGAGFMADGYSRGGKVGVAVTTSGPGVTNILTSIASANLDSSPMLVITGNAPLNKLGMDCFQEIDTTGITQAITKHNLLVKSASDIEQAILTGYHLAESGRKGVVLIDIPIDVANAKAAFCNEKPIVNKQNAVSDEAITKCATLINSSSSPLLYVGGGIVKANAKKEIISLSEIIKAPIVSTMMAVSAIPSSLPQYMGMVGAYGDKRAYESLLQADLIIAVGTRFSDRIAERRGLSGGAKIIHIDIDDCEIDKNVLCDCSVIGDAKEVTNGIIAKIQPVSKRDFFEQAIKKSKSSKNNTIVSVVIKALSEQAANNLSVIADVGSCLLWTINYFSFTGEQRFICSGGLGAMGFSLGAAIGSYLETKAPQLVFVGDGGFNMCANEIPTAIAVDADVKLVLFVNNTFGLVRQIQDIKYKGRHTATELSSIDYLGLSKALGAKAYEITADNYSETLQKALKETGVVVMIVKVPDNLYPELNDNYKGITINE